MLILDIPRLLRHLSLLLVIVSGLPASIVNSIDAGSIANAYVSLSRRSSSCDVDSTEGVPPPMYALSKVTALLTVSLAQ